MSQDELHQLATSDTPAHVEVPNNLVSLAIWAIGRFGIGIVFLGLLIPVYLDLKISNERFSQLSTANVQAITALAEKIERNGAKLDAAEEARRRIEDAINQKTK